jgi:hypothetical protein
MRLRIVLLTLVVAGVTAGVAAGGGNGSDKFVLRGPDSSADCDTGGLPGNTGDGGFAVINAPSDGTVEATVSLKGVAPNTTYNVYLIQGGADCVTVDATITTNGQGNGTAHVFEPSVSSHAWVGVETNNFAIRYVTELYNHQ